MNDKYNLNSKRKEGDWSFSFYLLHIFHRLHAPSIFVPPADNSRKLFYKTFVSYERRIVPGLFKIQENLNVIQRPYFFLVWFRCQYILFSIVIVHVMFCFTNIFMYLHVCFSALVVRVGRGVLQHVSSNSWQTISLFVLYILPTDYFRFQ